MKKVTVSAPGKLTIAGEHAVVYGKPSLIVAASLRLYVTLEKDTSPALGTVRRKDQYIDAIVGLFEKKYGIAVDEAIGITINSAIPVRSGMGSSAALAVALSGALNAWYGHPWNAQLINDAAYQAEKTKHKNSSGSDPAVATHGGIIWYRKEMEFLKTLWLLPFKVPKNFTSFILINTGRDENTGDLVNHVAAIKQQDEQAFVHILDAVEAVTKKATQAIHDEKETDFRESIRQNERLLEEMDIVSPATVSFIRDIEQSGGVAKISGAGGKTGGSGVILAVHDEPKSLVKLAKKHGYPSFQVELGGMGAKLEQILA